MAHRDEKASEEMGNTGQCTQLVLVKFLDHDVRVLHAAIFTSNRCLGVVVDGHGSNDLYICDHELRSIFATHIHEYRVCVYIYTI